MADRFVPLAARVGARVNLEREEVLDPGFADECLEALEHFGVLSFPRLDLDDDELVALSQNLGEIKPTGKPGPDGSAEPVYKVSLDPNESASAEYLKGTIGWHMDGLHDGGPPPRATLLTAQRLAAEGGQTEFCSTYAAYEDLPGPERERCDGLRVVHSLVASKLFVDPDASPEELEARALRGTTRHPLVWEHDSGRRSLILGMSVDHVEDVPEPEGRSLIDRLWAHTLRPENVYQHQWQLGDLVMWDNCGVMHRVTPYAVDSGRLMHRTTLHGCEQIRGVRTVAND